MITCAKCGNQNPLGRVFCVSCGAKLNLARISTPAPTKHRQVFGAFIRNIGAIFLTVVILLLIVVGLALWADTRPLGKPGAWEGGGRKVEADIARLRNARAGQPTTIVVKESDLNGYLSTMAERLHVQALSAEMTEGALRIRLVRRPLEKPIGDLNPLVSIDVLIIDGIGKIDSVYMGHLPLIGPARERVLSALDTAVGEDSEWSIFKKVTEVKCVPESLTVTVQK